MPRPNSNSAQTYPPLTQTFEECHDLNSQEHPPSYNQVVGTFNKADFVERL